MKKWDLSQGCKDSSIYTNQSIWYTILTNWKIKPYDNFNRCIKSLWQDSAPIYDLNFPGGSEDKASACNAGDPGSIPGLRRSPGEGNGNPLQYSCLENPMDRGAWWATVQGVTKSQTRLSNWTCTNLSPRLQKYPRNSTLCLQYGLVELFSTL